ncbi:MAG: heparan-alpha-glucosaminide N-acetyltransferase domain-containing protein [Microbacteriaceae bacterium]
MSSAVGERSMNVIPRPVNHGWGAAVVRRIVGYDKPNGTRLIGIDIARGLAVLGMFVAHTATTGSFDWATPSTWLDVANGRSSILFATLAGISIAIISGRRVALHGSDLLQARMRIVMRAVLIFALGGLLEFLGTGVAVILPMYALLFVLALPFLRWKPRSLFVLAGALALTMPLLQRLLVTIISEFGSSGVIVDLFVTGVYPGMIWIVFVLVGLAVGRLDLGAVHVRLWLLGAGLVLALVGYGIGAVADHFTTSVGNGDSSSSYPSSPGSSSSYDEGVSPDDINFDGLVCDRFDGLVSCYSPDASFDDDGYIIDDGSGQLGDQSFSDRLSNALSGFFTARAHSGTTIEVVASGGFALMIIALSLFAARLRPIRWLFFPVAAVGSMALTAYSGHIIALSIVGGSSQFEGNELLVAFTIAALIACSVWALVLGRGPFERLLTRVSHAAARLNDSEQSGWRDTLDNRKKLWLASRTPLPNDRSNT